MRIVASPKSLVEPPVVLDDVTVSVTYDGVGNPLIIAMQQTEDHIVIYTPADSNFNEIVEALGVSKRLEIVRS